MVEEHAEQQLGHEELYVVVRGRARFTLDGDEVDAPAGTLVFLSDPAVKRVAVAEEPDALVLAIGGKPGEAFTPSAWEWYFQAYQQPTDEGIKTMQAGNAEMGESGPPSLPPRLPRSPRRKAGRRTCAPGAGDRARPEAERAGGERRRSRGGSMSGYTVTRMGDIPPRESWIPVRDHFGIGAFGVNAYAPPSPAAG